MAVSPNSAALFLVDCSVSMAQSRPFTRSDGSEETAAPIDLAKTYVKSKIVQRLLRELKTTPVGVVTYAAPKTKNQLTQRRKDRAASGEGPAYDKEEDDYRNMYEHVSMSFKPDREMVQSVDSIQAGKGPDKDEGSQFSADAHSAVILGLETMCSAEKKVFGASWTRVVYLVTDGESHSEWDEWERTADRYAEKGISLVVVVVGFDDEEEGQFEQEKSATKRQNEIHLRSLVDRLVDHEERADPNAISTSVVFTLASALSALAQPTVKSVNSRKDPMTLTLGSPAMFPDSAITMRVEVKKATTVAANKALKKYSMKGFEKATGARREEMRRKVELEKAKYGGGGAGASTTKQDGEDEPMPPASIFDTQRSVFGNNSQAPVLASTSTSDPSSSTKAPKFSLGDIGRPLDRLLLEEGLLPADEDEEDLLSHDVTLEKSYRYRPLAEEMAERQKAKEKAKEERLQKHLAQGGQPETFEDEEDEEEEENDDKWENAMEEELQYAYAYGGEWVAAADMDSKDAGVLAGLQTGLEIVGFMKMSDVRMDWRMGDQYFVLPSPGQTGSNLTFSAFINAMIERNSCAIVRFVGKSHMDNKKSKMVWPDPKMGIMWPVCEGGTHVEFCYWCRMPFSEDVRKLTFASLTEVRTANGIVTEHPNIPTAEQQAAMDDFVDAMDLSTAGPLDEDGNATEWFSTNDSYNPAIHNIQNALVHRLSNAYGPLPPVPKELTKYLEPPAGVVEKAQEAAEKMAEAMNIKFVPPKPKKVKKNVNNFTAVTEGEGMFDNLVGDMLGGPPAPVEAAAPQSKAFQFSLDKSKGKEKETVKMEIDDDDESDYIMVDKPSETKVKPDPSPAKPKPKLEDVVLSDDDEEEPDTEDEGEASTTADVDMKPVLPPPTPSISIREKSLIADFRKALDEHGPDEALPPLFVTLQQLIKSSFSTQHYKEVIGALKKAREEARALGAVRIYNTCIGVLLTTARGDKSTRDFVSWIRTEGVGPIVGLAQEGVNAETAKKILED